MSTFGQISEFSDPFEWPAGGCYMAFDNYSMARIWNPGFEPDRSRSDVVIGLMVETCGDGDRLYETVKAAG